MKGKMPTGPMREHIRSITSPTALDRPTGRDDSTPGAQRTYQSDATVEDIYVYGATSNETVLDVGEVERGSMQGIALADADVRVGDRFDYADRRYEVMEPITYIPSNANAIAIQFPLERVHDPDTIP